MLMEKLHDFESAARENGFIEVDESEEETTVWFRKATPDTDTDVHNRLCVDSQTNSATVFWASLPWKINSKTFRSVSALQEWFASRFAKPRGSMTNREALLRLSTDKHDRSALTSLCENNAEIVRTAISRYFETGNVSADAGPVVMQRVADHARSYEPKEDSDKWVAERVNAECDRLRNETIQEKANRD